MLGSRGRQGVSATLAAMADVTAPTPTRRSRAPQWLFEGLDLIDQRRRALLITFGFIVVVAGVVAVLRPAILPPTPIVGAAIGLAALLLAVAVLIALDTADLKVRGPRHVRAAGGELVAVLPTQPSSAAATDLAEAIEEVRPRDRTLLLGVAAATGDGRRIAPWATQVARCLAERGTSVMSLDLTAEDASSPGFVEVVRDDAKLGEVVELDPDLRLAVLGPGRDAAEALRAFPEAGRWIPRDLEVLLVALPMAASRAVVRASLSLDQLLIVAERDRTSRVELIAGLDATEAVGTHSQVILVDDAYASYLGIDVGEVVDEQPLDTPGEDLPTADVGLHEPTQTIPAPVSDGDPAASESPDEQAASPDEATELDPGENVAVEASAEEVDLDAGEAAAPGEVESGEEAPEQEEADPAIEEPTTTGGTPDGDISDEEPEPPIEPDEEGAFESAEDVPDPDSPEPADDEPISEARDVDVVVGAAAASALASVEAYEQFDLEPPSGEGSDEPPERDELTVQISAPQPIEEDEITDEVERPDEADEEPQAGTQPPATQPDDEPDVEPAEEDDDEEDLLNTTARLSLLMEEVAERESDGNGT